MKHSIKRVQSQAGLSFAEREDVRPKVKQKLLFMLVLLLTATTGVWATTPNSIVINGTPTVGDNSISLTYHFDPANVTDYNYGYYPTLKVKCEDDNNKWDEVNLPIEASSDTKTITLTKLGGLQAGKTYKVCFAYNNGNWVDDVFQSFVPAGPATYSITLAEGTEDTDKWAISPAEAAEGSPVTATYNGTKKVKSVKAVKKAVAPTYTLLSAATTSDYGKVVCAAGHLHDAKTAVPDGCTAVGILAKVTETGHGLILALKDAPEQTWNTINSWTSASYAGTTLKVLPDDAARGTNLTSYTTLGETTVSNWAVAQIEDYDAIFKNLGSTKSDSGSMLYDDNVNGYITTGVGGTALSGEYWSAAELNADVGLSYTNEAWCANEKFMGCKIRPVLGF